MFNVCCFILDYNYIMQCEIIIQWQILCCCIMFLCIDWFLACCKISKSSSWLCHLCLSKWNNLAHTGEIFMKFDIWLFFENLSRKFKFHWNLTRIMNTLPEDVCIIVIISPWILLRMRNVSDKSCSENQNTELCSVTFFLIIPFMS